MIWFLVTLPFRFLGLGFKLGRLSMLLTHRSLRLLGYRRLLVFGAGVGVGLLVAPGSGTELRKRLQGTLAELRGASSARSSGGGPAADDASAGGSSTPAAARGGEAGTS